jgi:hypothetical protein
MRIRVPDPFDLALEPQLGPLLLLEVASALAINALRAHHVQLQGDPAPDEFDEAAAAHVVVTHCHRLLRALLPYRRRVIERLAHDHAAWFEADAE